MTKTEQLLMVNEDAVVYPELDFALIGLARRCGSDFCAIYDLKKIASLFLTGTILTTEVIADFISENYDVGGECSPVFLLPEQGLINNVERLNISAKLLVPVGFESSFMGIVLNRDLKTFVSGISYDKCLDDIISQIGDNNEESVVTAIEHMEFNVLGSWLGDDTPFFIEILLEE